MGESVARVSNSSMKNLLVTMFVALLIVGCGKDDLPICPSCGERATIRMNPRVELAEVKTYYKCAKNHNFNKDGVLVDYVGRPLKKKPPAPAPETPRPKPRTLPKKVSSAPMNLSTSAVEGKPFTIPDLSLEMLWVKPGTFEMGSPSSEKDRDDDETPHMVTLTQGFYLGKHEVTQSQWEKMMGSNPSSFRGGDLPVETVPWMEVIAFCDKLTASERAAGRLPAGMAYQLPTETQWEYACRAGTKTSYSFGVGLTFRQANISIESSGRPTDVGKYPANAWGFHDMHGNVLEWCADWYGDYPSGAVRDPVGPADGSFRVLRGGSWYGAVRTARSAARTKRIPTYRDLFRGFRLSLRPPASK